MFVAPTNTIGFNSAGEQTNPTTATVLATTGSKPHGRYICWVTISSTVAAQFDVQHRNAADGGNIEVATVYVPLNDSRQYVFGFVLEADERVRIVPNANITGDAVAVINWQRIS